MNNLSFLLTLSYNFRLAFSLFLISPQQHQILLLGHCCMYSILCYVFVYLICYRKKKKVQIFLRLLYFWSNNEIISQRLIFFIFKQGFFRQNLRVIKNYRHISNIFQKTLMLVL